MEMSPALTQGDDDDQGKEGRKKGGARFPAGPSHVCTSGARGPSVLRPGHPLFRAPPGWLGRSPHTRGGEATAAAGLGARSHSPQHAEPSNSAATRGHISAPAAGSPPPPQVSGAAAAAAVTGRTDRRRPSQAGPTAQAARPRARALPPLPARSPACSPPARAAHAHSAPPRNRGC